MDIIRARSPRWVDADKSAIDLLVVFDDGMNEEVPFTAHAQDCEVHGRELYYRAVYEEFGPVAEFVPPVIDPAVVLARNVQLRDDLMATAAQAVAPLQDAVDLGVASQDEQARLLAWKTYRIALNRLDLSKQPVSWPILPS